MTSRAVRASSLFALVVAVSCLTPELTRAQTRRVDLRILVLSSGADDYGTQMVRAGLDQALVPHTDVDLVSAGRAALTADFLVDTSTPGVRRARFQAVVLPNQRPSALSDAERATLASYEREFRVRQLDAYVAPGADLGLSAPLQSGTLDGATAAVTPAGAADAFAYLKGPVPFEDLEPRVFETYGYLAAPLAAQDGREFTPFVEATLPGTGARGAIVGVYEDDGREEMALLVAMNPLQIAQRMLFPGILTWLTRGVHLGSERAYLAMHVDDLFQDNGRWSETKHCTLTDDCEPNSRVQRIIMTPADVDYLVDWQTRNQLMLDLAFNGGIYAENAKDDRPNARIAQLGQKLIGSRAKLRWINHTYTHEYLGCVENADKSCVRSRAGQVQWTPYQTTSEQIAKNIEFAKSVGITIDPSELVTGEHSGLRRPDREPSDNPNLLRALSDLRVAWIGADDSLEQTQRSPTAGTLTVPRYPMSIYYNCGTKREDTQEYNWLYSAAKDGGSGRCEGSGSCLAPLDPERGFDAVIVPREVRTMLMHVLGNDPRPHYAHQSNLAEDRILYPVLEGVLAAYREVFSGNRPIVNPTMKEAGIELQKRSAFKAAQARLDAYVEDNQVVLRMQGSAGDAALEVPLTLAPARDVLTPYGGSLQSGWQHVDTEAVRIPLADGVAYAR